MPASTFAPAADTVALAAALTMSRSQRTGRSMPPGVSTMGATLGSGAVTGNTARCPVRGTAGCTFRRAAGPGGRGWPIFVRVRQYLRRRVRVAVDALEHMVGGL